MMTFEGISRQTFKTEGTSNEADDQWPFNQNPMCMKNIKQENQHNGHVANHTSRLKRFKQDQCLAHVSKHCRSV